MATLGSAMPADDLDTRKAFDSITTTVKWLGLYPPITADERHRKWPYRLLNLGCILLSSAFYAYLLLYYSLDSQFVKAGTGSLIAAHIHDIYFVTRFVSVVAVPLHAFVYQGEVSRLFEALNRITCVIVLISNRKDWPRPIGYPGTVRCAKHLRLVAVVYPLVCATIASTIFHFSGRSRHAGRIFPGIRLLYFYSYVHFWLQATMVLLLVLARYLAVNRIFSSVREVDLLKQAPSWGTRWSISSQRAGMWFGRDGALSSRSWFQRQRKQHQSLSIYDALRLFSFVCKWFGLVPVFTDVEQCGGRGRILRQVANVVAMCGHITFSVCMYVGFLQKATVYERLAAGFMVPIVKCIQLHHQCIVLITMLLSVTNRRKLSTAVQKLHEVDQALASGGISINLRCHLQLIRVVLVLVFVLPALLHLYVYFFFKRLLGDISTHSMVFIIVGMVLLISYVLTTLQAIFSVLTVKVRFSALNRMMRMYFPTTPAASGCRSEFAICSEKEQINVLKQIKILHDKLNDVVELVNYCFSVQITFCVGLCFVIGVVCSFGLFRAFIYRNELFYIGVLNFVWYLYYLFFVLFFIAVGSKITREGKRIGVLVHKAINCSTSTAVINELNIFSQQLLHRCPVITCGLFVYDWTLWYTMIGATATYLIILIQFDVSFPNLVNVNATAVFRPGT